MPYELTVHVADIILILWLDCKHYYKIIILKVKQVEPGAG